MTVAERSPRIPVTGFAAPAAIDTGSLRRA
jgi:hypothetical protein